MSISDKAIWLALFCLPLLACSEPGGSSAAQSGSQSEKTAGQVQSAQQVAPPVASMAVALDGEGLRLISANGASVLLAFDQSRQDVVSALIKALGVPTGQSTNTECGAGVTDFVDWGNGLSALFLQDRFVGWSLGPEGAGGLTTMNGIGVGSARNALLEVYSDTSIEESSLGMEFAAGGLSGLLDSAKPNGRIETLWAGTACVFR